MSNKYAIGLWRDNCHGTLRQYPRQMLLFSIFANIVIVCDMIQGINIRSATLNDLPDLLKFEQGIISTERPFDETLVSGTFHYYDLAERIQDPDAEVVVAESDGTLVAGGSAIIKKGDSYNTFDRYAFLGFMYVEPAYRGKGINSLIIKKLVEWSEKKGLKEIRLHVYSDNINAINAYEKVGFKKILTEMRLTR
jgi:ribosomal protein S18 acetylase RimI-like enzyme